MIDTLADESQPEGVDDVRLRDEVRTVCDPLRAVPDTLPHLMRTVTRSMQLAAAAEELPHIARCVAEDESVGHRRSPSADALMQIDGAALRPSDALAAFKACRIGEERLADDRGSVAFERIADRVVQLGMLVAHQRNHASTSRSVLAWLSGAPMSPLWRAVQANARHRTWAVVVLAVLLATGAGLVVASAWPASARLSAITVGTAVAGLGALGAAVLARRIRAMLIASVATVVVVVALTFVNPWAWRGWLLAAVTVDVLLSLRRRFSHR